MIQGMILVVHISAGMASFVLAPLYIIFAMRGQSLPKLRTAFKGSIIATASLGVMLLLTGAPIGRTCLTLSAYTMAMVGVLKFSDVLMRKHAPVPVRR